MSNINIEYKYREFWEIFENVKNIWEFSYMELSILFILILFVIVCVLYIFPIIGIIKDFHNREKEKQKKKLSLKQIIINKEIETEIENEFKREQEEIIKNKI